MANKKYWEIETPETVQTERNFLRYFHQAGRFQVAGVYKDNAGEAKQGKTSTLDLEDLAANPAGLELLQQFINDARELGGKAG
jgi:hypothetical protein